MKMVISLNQMINVKFKTRFKSIHAQSTLKTKRLKFNSKNKKMAKTKTMECQMCEGEGKVNMSCCGYNLHGKDSDLCPDCGEHCGDETESCYDCDGSGSFEMTEVEFENEKN